MPSHEDWSVIIQQPMESSEIPFPCGTRRTFPVRSQRYLRLRLEHCVYCFMQLLSSLGVALRVFDATPRVQPPVLRIVFKTRYLCIVKCSLNVILRIFTQIKAVRYVLGGFRGWERDICINTFCISPEVLGFYLSWRGVSPEGNGRFTNSNLLSQLKENMLRHPCFIK